MRIVTSHVKWVGISSRWCPTSSIPLSQSISLEFQKGFWLLTSLADQVLLAVNFQPTFTNFRRPFFGLNPSRAWSLHTWISGENFCANEFVIAMWELEIAVLNQTFSMGTGVEDDWIFFPYRKAKWSSLQRKGNLKCFKTMFYPLEN